MACVTLIEGRDTPEVINAIPRETAANDIVHAAALHGFERMSSSLPSGALLVVRGNTTSPSSVALLIVDGLNKNSIVIGCGNFGAGPQPP